MEVGPDTDVASQSAKTIEDEVLRDFSEACLLHGLIDRDQAQQIVKSEQGSMMPQRALETKQQSEELLRRKAEAAEQIVAGMTAMDGNAVSRAEAIAEVCSLLTR